VMTVATVEESEVRDAVEKAIGEGVGGIKAVDITFKYNGEEVQSLTFNGVPLFAEGD